MDISVITPFYKGNNYMSQLFASIRTAALAVPEASIEFILVNDSPDCPIVYEEDWVRGFALHIICNDANCGIHGSRVNGLHQAQGEFIWFLDQDDLLAEDAFASMLALRDDADVIVANGYFQTPKGSVPIYATPQRHRAAIVEEFYYRVCNQITSPGHCLIRSSAIPESWCQHIMGRNGSDDLLLWLVLFHENLRWKINPAMLYTHVDTGINLSADISKMVDSSMEVLNILKKLEIINKKQTRQFLRSRRMAAAVSGTGIKGKFLASMRYPDVALDRLRLRLYR